MNTPKSQSARILAGAALGLLCLAPALAWRAKQNPLAAPSTSAPPAGKADADKKFKYTNKLIGATSPYLLEHAHNPVNWQPWGAAALEQARRENKPIFLSIGYSACHWCHVMAREDFENEEIARILNANFVCIKVDREQRPDLDAQYMLAVQLMTESGGWPLSVFLTPDRKPFYGGTYYPPEEFKTLLGKVVEANKTQPERIQALAARVADAVARASAPRAALALTEHAGAEAVGELTRRFDPAQGGFETKPKFPDAPRLAFLLARYRRTGEKRLLDMTTTTLDRMAGGGIYDQIGGGFHRYSTDARWRVPHFEKMLYDQALLIPLYLEAWQITRKPRYRQIVEETLAFARRELRDPDGGFYSTLDADSEGEEGKFYLWTPAQITDALGADADLFMAAYGVTPAGDLDGKSVLHLAAPLGELAQKRGLKPEELAVRLDALRRKLLAARAARVRPGVDDKILASWNGLMLGAYARAAQSLNDPALRQTAVETATFLMQKMRANGKLLHCWRAGRADTPGMLEDDAYVASGLLDLYEATGDKQWLAQAQILAEDMDARFTDKALGGYYDTVDKGELLTRMMDAQDNALPSPNGVAAQVLARLAVATGRASWRAQGQKTTRAFGAQAARAPYAFCALLTAQQMLDAPPNSKP